MNLLPAIFRRAQPSPLSLVEAEASYGPIKGGVPDSLKPAQPTIVQPKIADFAPVFWGGRRLDPSQVRVILQNAAQGSLQDQFELFALMEDTWPRLLKNLAEVRRTAARGTFAVQPYATRGKKPTSAAQEKADLVEAAIKNWQPRPGTLEFGFEDALFHSLDAYGKGISVLEINWQQTPEGTLPRCAYLLSPRSYGWNGEGNELGLTSGGGSGISNLKSQISDWQPFPEGQFWCGIWQARSGAPGSTAMLRALAPYWVGITFGWEWLLATAQIFGVPFRWATYDPTRPELLTTLTAMLAQMATAGYAAFPAGTTLEFKDAIARSTDNPQILIQSLADKACDLLVLGQEGSGAQHAQGLNGSGQSALQGEVRREVLHAAAQWCADLLNYQFVPALMRYNWGDTSEPPTIVPDLAGDPDPVQLAERDVALSGIPGVLFVKKSFYERHGLPEPEEGDETIGGQVIQPTFPPQSGPSTGSTAPGGDNGSPASDSADPAKTPQEDDMAPGSDMMAGKGVKARSFNPPRSAVPPSAIPGAYRLPEATRAALAAAHARDFAPLRQAAEPLLAAIEAGNLDVVGELEAFIGKLDTLAPHMIGAGELADSLEAALAEAAIAGAAGVYRKAAATPVSSS